MASTSLVIATLQLAVVLCASLVRAQNNFFCITCNSALSTTANNQSWCLDPYIPPSAGANTTTGQICFKASYTLTSGTNIQQVVARGAINSALASTLGINTGCASNTALSTLPFAIPAGYVCGCRGDYCNAATVGAPSSRMTILAAAAGVVLFVAARRLH